MLSKKTFDNAIKDFNATENEDRRSFALFLSSGHRLELLEITLTTTTAGFEIHGSDDDGDTIAIDPTTVTGIKYFSEK